MALKLAPLLVQYLYANKRLDLPGLGSFFIKESEYPEPEHHRHEKQSGMETVYFESNATIKQSPDLIQFIAEHSGKIKALAAADLESHLALAKQFLNIGNPFLFEGIGNLEKIKSGEYELTPGPRMQEKTKDQLFRGKKDSPATEETHEDYKKIFYSGKSKPKWRKPFVFVLIIAGIALAAWGGYTVYKMTKAKNKSAPAVNKNNKKEETLPVKDSVMYQKDSVVTPVQITPAGKLKFVLEVADAKRANERYGRLKTFLWDVQLETKDSLSYKIFMLLPASASDTTRMLDSLSRLNGKRVYVEQ
jgi:hypothetical protein